MANSALRRMLRWPWLWVTLVAAPGSASYAQANSVMHGNVRFQVLSPTLVRMEYSPTGKFTDAASVSVIGRDGWPVAKVSRSESGGWLSIGTGKMVLKYRTGSGAFAADSLLVSWTDQSGTRTWKPGDRDDANLGGVPASLDNIKELPEVPGALSRSGYFLLDDSRSPIWNKKTDWIEPRPEKDSQDWYFFVYGQDYAHVLAELSKLLGPSPMVPRYTLGAWFTSRAGYSDAQWKMIVERFRDESLPLDMMVMDSDSCAKMIWAGYDFDPEQMPDPKGFFQWMRNHGIEVSRNEHYGAIAPDNDSRFDQLRRSLGLPGTTREIPHDLADKKYARLFMDLLHKPALDDGLAFWWQDGHAGANMEGLDPLLWTRHVEYTGSERITGKRSMIFCRLGDAWGSHRYGSFFTGDMESSWNTLDIQALATVRAGNKLVAWMNNDCGGIAGVDIGAELYCRFVQFGSLSPIMRLHSVWGLRLPWEYGKLGMDTYRTFVGLRYALVPYICTYGRVAHETGLPLARGMYIEYPDQEPAYSLKRQYMFGRELLVAPVTTSGNGRPVRKEVYLPKGDCWFDYSTGDIYTGGRTIDYQCPIERMPLFARAGSIIPMAPPMDYTRQKPVDPLTLDVYAGKSAKFKLYEDDGISFDYRKGSFAWTPIAFAQSPGRDDYQLTIGPCKGRYKGQPQTRRYLVRVRGLLKPSAIKLDGKKLSELPVGASGEGWRWDRKARTATVIVRRLPVGRRVALSIENAGAFEDAIIQQRALNLRSQVRQTKRVMKTAHVRVLGGGDIRKPPRMIRETEEVERRLDAIVADPRLARRNQPDFDAMKSRVMSALADQPFESRRKIPDVDQIGIDMTEKIANASLTQEEIAKITSLLRGADLPAVEDDAE